MDKWEELMKNWGTLGIEEQNKVQQESQAQCQCSSCPTYARCARQRGEMVFCLRNKSSCIKDMKACFCSRCLVHDRYALTSMYYCLRGNEGEHRKAMSDRSQ